MTRGGVFWAVGGLAAVLAGAVMMEAVPAPGGAVGPDAPSAPVTVAAATAPQALPIDDWVTAALGRPLFAQDRRPDAAAATGHDALPRLSGTIRFAATSLAIFQPVTPDGTGKSVVVGQGADLAGWTVTDITNDGVTLMRDGRLATLRLSYANLPLLARRLSPVPGRVLHDKRTSVFWQP